MKRPLRWMVSLSLVGMLAGCHVAGSNPVGQALVHGRDNIASRVTFLKWNMSSRCEAAERLTVCSRALELASQSPFELDSLMRRQPAPSLEIVNGRWLGINKGVGAAAAGITQDIKVIRASTQGGKGYNVAVHQVSLHDLDCHGFKAKTNLLTGCEKTMGNFVVVPTCSSCEPLKLDYTQADNGLVDPSRWLVDELVMMDHDMLLGKAYAKIGQHLMPVAYFVLIRAEGAVCDQCDEHGCDEASN